MPLQANGNITLSEIGAEFGVTGNNISFADFYRPKDRRLFYTSPGIEHNGNGAIFFSGTSQDAPYITPSSNLILTLNSAFVGNLFLSHTPDGGNTNVLSNIIFNNVTGEEIRYPKANDYVLVNFANLTFDQTIQEINSNFSKVSRNANVVYVRTDNTTKDYLYYQDCFIVLEDIDTPAVPNLDVSAVKFNYPATTEAGNNYALAHGGEFVDHLTAVGGNSTGIIKPGKSIQVRGDIDAFTAPATTYIYNYLRIFEAFERDDEDFPGFYTFSAGKTARFSSNPSYINDGTYTNSATSVAALMKVAFDNGTDFISANSNIGSDITVTSNVTGTNLTVDIAVANSATHSYYISYYGSSTGSYAPVMVGYSNTASQFTFTYLYTDWGYPWQTQQYGSPHSLTYRANIYRNDLGTYSNSFNTVYVEHGANASNITARIIEDAMEFTNFFRSNSTLDHYRSPNIQEDGAVIEYLFDSGFIELTVSEGDGAGWSNVTGLGGNAVGNIVVENFSTNRFGNNNSNILFARDYEFNDYYEAQRGPSWIKIS